jgi:putative colanic acid biosynthesis UDP-glucose lipid carrier transferase
VQTTRPDTEFAPNLPSYSFIHTENAILTSFVANRRFYLLLKRSLDISVSLLLIMLVLTWLVPIIGILIRLESRGPVFFIQERMGFRERVFWCIKFRTMVLNSESDQKAAEENDTRITRCGRLLRNSRIDELPQLLNVLMGTMSLTGPRPHMLADCQRFSNIINSYNFRYLVKPGITGLAQVKGYRGPANDDENIKARYYWDEAYVRKAGFWLDLKILWRTCLGAGIGNWGLGIGLRT